MEYKVTIANQQQSFLVQENEKILEAAIRAGVSLNYGCSSGTCGLCKAQIISGSVKEIKPREYVIPESEKLQQYMLSCVCAAEQDLVIDAVVASTAADIPEQIINVKVRKVEQLSTHVIKLLVQTPRTKRLRFLAGQYLHVKANESESNVLSIASCPCEDRLIELHMRLAIDDSVSLQSATNIRQGDSMELRGPFGDFTYDDNANRPVVLFAFDTGFAPIKSLLEHITAQEQELNIHLIWMSCGEDGLYMHNLCRSWQDAFDGFTYHGITLKQSLQQLAADPLASCATVESHMVDAMQCHKDLSCHDIYAAAPEPATEIFRRVCLNKNMLEKRFFSEPVRGNEDMTCIMSLK